tara:strand:- start:156 stop:644 length:489 start_codon:yes stop_codon:yes gene_type:complete
METIAEFNDNDGLNVKLTSDKIYISAASGEETFALRSVNGVGTYDDINKFAEENEKHSKHGKGWKIGFYIMAASCVFILGVGIANGMMEAMGGMLIVYLGITGLFYWKMKKGAGNPPILDSYIKFMISGNERRFKFNKSDESSAAIADFLNKVEDTLTAYNK